VIGHVHPSGVNRVRLGSAFRAIRLELHLRQSDVASRAGVSQATISAIERGLLDVLAVGTLDRVAAVLQADLSVELRWRGPKLARLLDRRHAALQNLIVSELLARGWQVLVEESFNVFGERGSVDIVAWLPGAGALLIIEIKTELVDLQDLLRTVDMKTRVVPEVVRRSHGWQPVSVASVVVLPSSNSHRRAVAAHASLLDAALPGRTREVRRWIRQPAGALRGIWFFPCIDGGNGMEQVRARRRVRLSRNGPAGPGTGSEGSLDAANRALAGVAAHATSGKCRQPPRPIP
jgi:transcriptional regulator with XRE-family HTH domain